MVNLNSLFTMKDHLNDILLHKALLKIDVL